MFAPTSPKNLATSFTDRRERARLREAARILALLIPMAHAAADDGPIVRLQVELPIEAFDRLCVWGAALEDLEPNGDDEADGIADDGGEEHEAV